MLLSLRSLFTETVEKYFIKTSVHTESLEIKKGNLSSFSAEFYILARKTARFSNQVLFFSVENNIFTYNLSINKVIVIVLT